MLSVLVDAGVAALQIVLGAGLAWGAWLSVYCSLMEDSAPKDTKAAAADFPDPVRDGSS